MLANEENRNHLSLEENERIGLNDINFEDICYPAPLRMGDKIALLSPASVVKEEYVRGAMEKLREHGYEPELMQYALGPTDGNFSSSRSCRLMDLFTALEDSEIKAILCTRGGYGCCQLLENLSGRLISRNPKWLIGFSDVSALHAAWLRSGIASIHGPMAKHLATNSKEDVCSRALFEILETGGRFDYTFPSHEYNRTGRTIGTLRGGNLAVLNDLSNTPYDILDIKNEDKEGVILFIEDINEPIYKINRILHRLLLSGTLHKLKGLVFGQFTDYKPEKNYSTMETMINEFINRTIVEQNYPIAFNFPVGHSDLNFPLTEGARVEFEVTGSEVRLSTIF